jgi:hypothetical protein
VTGQEEYACERYSRQPLDTIHTEKTRLLIEISQEKCSTPGHHEALSRTMEASPAL